MLLVEVHFIKIYSITKSKKETMQDADCSISTKSKNNSCDKSRVLFLELVKHLITTFFKTAFEILKIYNFQ
jgi:hypothetical protein